MKSQHPVRRRLVCFLVAILGMIPAVAEETHVLIVVGPSNHPPGSHEVAAGGRLMKHCLESAPDVRGVVADVVYEWPKDEKVLDRAQTVVFIGDTFPPNRMPGSDAILAKLGAMMNRGCGIVCVHYATGLRAEDVKEDGEHPLLHWMGGYFATRCPHHQSVARIYPAATIVPASSFKVTDTLPGSLDERPGTVNAKSPSPRSSVSGRPSTTPSASSHSRALHRFEGLPHLSSPLTFSVKGSTPQYRRMASLIRFCVAFGIEGRRW